MRGDSAYESWVVTLRAWRDDPSVPLNDLPALTEESLPRNAFDRFFKHLFDALEGSTQRWEKSFRSAIGDYRDHHDLADRLVKQRAGLARRMQLASHPSLPESVRTALTTEFERMVHRLQEEFETNTRSALTRSMAPQSTVEQLMRTIRENSMVAVLRLSITQDGGRASVVPLPGPGGGQAAPVRPRGRRALITE